jgi:restriction system protein
MVVPNYDDMFNALLNALHQLGGSASNTEIEEQVVRNLNLSEEQVNETHRGNRTKFSYNLAWTRSYLKNYGLIENSSRGIWSLTEKGLSTKEIDKNEVNHFVKSSNNTSNEADEEIEENEKWKTDLLNTIINIDPSAFERLCQRILRESGFGEVKVTGKSGDGGIDGEGIYKLGVFLVSK